MQMLFSIIISYLPYAVITAFTPGPNNVIALHSISQNGWSNGKNIVFGIIIGFLSVMIICALFCYELAKYVPFIANILKYIGAAYIVYLAVHILMSKPLDNTNKNMSFMKGLLLQFVNVKIILYAITVYTAYVLPHSKSLKSLLVHSIVISVIGMAGILTWALAGGILQRFLKKYYHQFNIVMAVILVLCAVSLLF
ncbi:LysE family transporter [Brachyspira alvinipulli]|uniref:LysE family transporter n=1 Tax=Brachyspira alvinipulli TaxID=84379 RepID=UPI00068775E4|nr:LysE family transporter [Brachyspira alvinipulli]